MEEGFESQKKEPWRVLEFYSGIGGNRYSLMKAGINAEVVEAFDINDTANDVYQHNFGHRPYQIVTTVCFGLTNLVAWPIPDVSLQLLAGNIQSLTATDLDAYKAHAWLLSPPCQPYTRQGLQRHSGDARAFSFLRILELIPQTSQPPMMLFVENVVGFESSDTHEKMIEVLAEADFVIQEFILSPIQFGVPYSRPRYFCLAKRRPRAFLNQHLNYKILQSPIPLFRLEHDSAINESAASQDNNELVDSCEPIDRFLEFSTAAHRISRDSIDFTKEAGERNGIVVHDDHYLVPLNLIERWGSAMDIVYPDSRRCCCFTKSYYRYVKGTGSLLATVQPKMKGKASSLKDQGLRYFTPREVANLHSFPEDFDFPQHVSLKQRYALLGNSLSIAVVAPLFRYLFAQAS